MHSDTDDSPDGNLPWSPAGWQVADAPLNAPAGGGGPGKFFQAGPLSLGADWPLTPWPDFRSPASRFQVPFPEGRKTKDAHAPAKTPKAVKKEFRPPQLTVSQGQVTFDAEGTDVAGSRYFSRVIHWPGNAESGVTLGRGYDMGNRNAAQVELDLRNAGMAGEAAQKFSAGAGPTHKGLNAKKFVDDNKQALGEISHEVQQKLFENIYSGYVKKARENYAKWTVDAKGHSLQGRVEWDQLKPAIRDILVDFVYQGFTKGPAPMTHGMKNDYNELIRYIRTNPTMKQYEGGRHRAEYLEAAQKAEMGPKK